MIFLLYVFVKALEVMQRDLGMEHSRTMIVRRNLTIARPFLLQIPRSLPPASQIPAMPAKPVFEKPSLKKGKKKTKKKSKK